MKFLRAALMLGSLGATTTKLGVLNPIGVPDPVTFLSSSYSSGNIFFLTGRSSLPLEEFVRQVNQSSFFAVSGKGKAILSSDSLELILGCFDTDSSLEDRLELAIVLNVNNIISRI